MKLIYDDSVETTYPVYVCLSCGYRFSSGGNAIHSENCPDRGKGYQPCVALVGPRQVEAIKEKAATFRPDILCYDVSLNMLREQLPELMQA